jgi:hypothetical protein
MHAAVVRNVALHVVTHDCSCCEAVQAGVEQHNVVSSVFERARCASMYTHVRVVVRRPQCS